MVHDASSYDITKIPKAVTGVLTYDPLKQRNQTKQDVTSIIISCFSAAAFVSGFQ